ncbi:hypothetical protein [Gudongella sp. DL1XJH-153]|uniref:hypothetical protein n=1 Tax=Gudongella sp. DL1XJH-153 TaxID=3409804 RepID=UPI003BB6841A
MTNKKWVLILMSLILVIALAACGNNEEEAQEPEAEPPVQEEPVQEAEEDEKEVIMEEFRDIVEEGEASVSNIKQFMHENLPVLGELEGNYILDNLENALKKEIEVVNLNIEQFDAEEELMDLFGDRISLPENMIGEIDNLDLRSTVQDAYDNHYKLISREGQIEAVIDYSSLKEYQSKVTDEWKEYIDIMAIESDDPAYNDGALTITFDQLAERILRIENYLNRYISGPRQEELLEMYENQLTAYYKGLPNTPIAAYDSGVVMENVYKSYESTAANEGYVTSSMINEYRTAIRDNDMIVDDSILSLADQYIDESVRVLREFK